MCSGNIRGLISGNGIQVVGTFVRALKKDGTMLFKPVFKDSAFISDLKYLYHVEFGTKWKISSICQVHKGFHIRLADVDDIEKAKFFEGEQFGLYKDEIAGRSIDMIVGEKIFSESGKLFGEVISVSSTPVYMLIQILKSDGETVFVPFTDQFIVMTDGRMELLKEV